MDITSENILNIALVFYVIPVSMLLLIVILMQVYAERNGFRRPRLEIQLFVPVLNLWILLMLFLYAFLAVNGSIWRKFRNGRDGNREDKTRSITKKEMFMREIKFRGRGTEGGYKGEWGYGDLGHQPGHYGLCTIWMKDRNYGTGFDVDPETVGQFTGVTDMHGRDIYEGDVVKIDGCPEKGLLAVVFHEGSFALATPREYGCIKKGEHPYLNDYTRLTDLGVAEFQGLYRIVGNIHDNPELMEETEAGQ